MSNSSTTEMILLEATQILSTPPVPVPDFEPAHVRAALRRCRTAWHRAYKAEMDKTHGNEGDDVFACFYGGRAYRKAMPILSNYESIQAYIACAAHGLLIGAIAPEDSGHILYAAQVAIAALNYAPKASKSASA